VNKYKEAFACSGQSRAAQKLNAPPTANAAGPETEINLTPQQQNSGHKKATQT
jgi:hypothetical protein